MGSNFEASFFTANRERLRTLFTGTAPIILTANGLLQRNSDVTFPFRQDSTFWYLTGINDPDITLIIDKSREYLIIPSRDTSREAFDGHIDHAALVERSGVATVYEEKEGWEQLGARVKKVKHIATLAPSPTYVSQHGLYTNPARVRLLEKVKKYNSDIEPLDLRPQISHMRVLKQPAELAAIQAAIDLTTTTLTKLKKQFNSYAYEYELEAAISAEFRSAGRQHAYQPIVAAGANACTLHYIDNDSPIAEGSLLLIDVGAEVDNYAADITRTYSIGSPTKRQQQVYEAVLTVQEFALECIRPGVVMRDYENQVQAFMGEKLRELGLIKVIEQETVRKYFPHGTSHFLGLDVHDTGDYDKPFEPGMVLTVEPGVYIPEEGIGIRIEDDVLVTAEGLKVLSDVLPRVLE